MELHQQRVVEEKKALDEKRDKLSNFMCGNVFFTLTKDERRLLMRQSMFMAQYSEVLGERISAFK